MLKSVIKNENDSVDNSANKANVIKTNEQNSRRYSMIENAERGFSRTNGNDLNEPGSDEESSSSCKNAGKLDLLAKAAETIKRDEEMFSRGEDGQRTSFESLKEFLDKNSDSRKMHNFLKGQDAKKPKINSILLNNNNLNHLNDINQALNRGKNDAFNSNDEKALSMAAAAAAAAAMANGLRGGANLEDLKFNERQQQLNKLIQSSTNSALLESFLGASGNQQIANSKQNFDQPADAHAGNIVDLSLLQTLFNANNPANATNSAVHPSVYNVAFENHANYLLNNNLASKNNPVNKSASGNIADANANLMALNALAYAKSMPNNPLASFINGTQNGHSGSGSNGLSSPNSTSPAANNYPMFIGKNGKPTRPFKAYPREPLSLPLGCTPALLQLQNAPSSPSPAPSSNSKSNVQIGNDRTKSNSPQNTTTQAPAPSKPAQAPNGNPTLGANLNLLLSNPNMLVALQALLGQQQQQQANPMQPALALENILGLIAALSAPNNAPAPASPTLQRASPPTPTPATPSMPNQDMLHSGQSTSPSIMGGSIPIENGDLASSLLGGSNFSSSLDISSLSAFTSTDFCTQYRKRIQQAQERLLNKQRIQQQQSDDSDEKSSSGKRRPSSTGRKRSNASQLNEYSNSRESNSESNSPTRLAENSRDTLLAQEILKAAYLKQLSEAHSAESQQLKQHVLSGGSALLTGAESPESDPRQSPTSSPDTTGEYCNYPPKKRLRMQQQDSENKGKSNESLNESSTGDGSVAESAVTTSSNDNNLEKSHKAGDQASSNLNKENFDHVDESDKAETETSSLVTNADVDNELIDSTSSSMAASNNRLFMNDCGRHRSSRFQPNSVAATPSLSLSISSNSSSSSGIGSCLSSSSPPLSTSSSIYSSLTSSSSSCSSSISNDPNTLFNNNINIGNITSLVGHHISRQRSTNNNKTSTTSANDPNSGSNSNAEEKITSKTISSRNSSTDADMDKDEAYKERRRKNNEAAKRSRDARRAKEDDIALRAAILERENLQLKVEVAQLKQETNKLRCMLYNS